jgi:hypothetical protein
MATYSRQLLSGSTNGKSIKVVATATAGTTIHTAIAGTTAFDEIYAWVTNTDTVARNLTIEYGGVTDPDNLICKTVSIPALSGPIPILTGQVLQNALVIGAFCDSANKLLITGYVNRIQ